jgi:hypothetical protein
LEGCFSLEDAALYLMISMQLAVDEEEAKPWRLRIPLSHVQVSSYRCRSSLRTRVCVCEFVCVVVWVSTWVQILQLVLEELRLKKRIMNWSLWLFGGWWPVRLLPLPTIALNPPFFFYDRICSQFGIYALEQQKESNSFCQCFKKR